MSRKKMNILVMIIREIIDILFYIVSLLPGRSGAIIRRVIIKILVKKCGKNLKTEFGLIITGFKNITFGNNCNFMRHCSFNSDGEGEIIFGNNVNVNYNVNFNSSIKGFIKIGDNFLCGPNTVFRTSNHIFSNKSLNINEQGHSSGKIIIGNNVWIGSNCVILKNVHIGNNSIIGAGSIIRKNVKENEIITGLDPVKYKKTKYK